MEMGYLDGELVLSIRWIGGGQVPSGEYRMTDNEVVVWKCSDIVIALNHLLKKIQYANPKTLLGSRSEAPLAHSMVDILSQFKRAELPWIIRKTPLELDSSQSLKGVGRPRKQCIDGVTNVGGITVRPGGRKPPMVDYKNIHLSDDFNAFLTKRKNV